MAAWTSAPPSGTAMCLPSNLLPRQPHPHPSSSPHSGCPASLQSSQSLRLRQRRRWAALRPAATPAGSAAAAATAEASDPWVEDRSIQVKLMLAESSGRLDLSDCGLARLPPGVFDIEGLEDLSLAGNELAELSEDIGRLTALKRLQLAGNQLRTLPESISALVALEGAWLHGNLLEALPEGVGALGALTQLSLAGNRLRALPQALGGLSSLKELSLAGNQLEALPASLGQLAALTKLSLHGNRLGPASLPGSLPGLQALEELWLQGNPSLTRLPAELGQLPRLKHLSAADCALECVPAELGSLPALQTLSLYGNRLREVSPAICQAPQVKQVWLEGNPLSQACTLALLEAAAASARLTVLGMDACQLEGIPGRVLEAVGGKLRPCVVHGSGPGYFKLDLAHGCWGASASGSDRGSGNSGSLLAAGETSSGRQQGIGRAQLLVVSFGSAPGTPNWGGVLGKVRAAGSSSSSSPGQDSFDVLYVVDPYRAWYGGGDDGAYRQYAERLGRLTCQYEHVVFIGDSMGATAALLFAELATSVHAFCPQIDLSTSSIRPGQPGEWQAALRERVMQSVQSSRAHIQVHVGNWSHDLDQARLLPPERVQVKIYSVDSHRLALYLDKKGKLQQVIRGAVLQELGLPSGQLRLTNLV